MKSLDKELSKCKHPNSRKTKSIAKRAKRIIFRNDDVQSKNLKRTVVANKIRWFLEHLDPSIEVCTAKQTRELIERYLSRFNEELEQIAIKRSIGKRKSRQHANREDVIKMTIQREQEEYDTCGLEIPNLLNSTELAAFQRWNGDLISIQHLKLTRINKQMLE